MIIANSRSLLKTSRPNKVSKEEEPPLLAVAAVAMRVGRNLKLAKDKLKDAIIEEVRR
jgi:hypothetical protein